MKKVETKKGRGDLYLEGWSELVRSKMQEIVRIIIGTLFKLFFLVNKQKENIYIKKLANLYSYVSFSEIFVKIRFWDAPLEQVERLLPKSGNIIELGCGEGLGSNYFAMSGPQRNIFGVDIDSERVSQAFKGLKNTKFIKGDITKINIPQADTILLVHVLHHLHSRAQQEKIINQCSKKLKKEGSLLIVEVEPKFSYKYFLTWFTDHFLVPWLFEKRFYSPIYFRKKNEWVDLLSKMGFKVKVVQADQGKPFTHIIFIAKQ